MGAIFRTADAAGVSKIILCGYTPAPVDRFGRENKGLIKASLGAEKNIEWEKAENFKEVIKKLKNYSSGHSQKCTDIFLLKNSSCSAQSASQGISDNTHSNNFLAFKIVAIEQSEKAIDYRKIKKIKAKNVALVFGNEVEGLSKKDLELCDYIAELPMLGKKESLNVSVCTGIVLYSLIAD